MESSCSTSHFLLSCCQRSQCCDNPTTVASQIWVSILRHPVETNVPCLPLSQLRPGCALMSCFLCIPSSDEDFHPLPFTHTTHPPTIFWTCSQIHSKPPAATEQTFLVGETQRKIHMEQHASQLASQVNKIRACSRFAATALRKVFQKPLSCELHSLKSAPNLQ